MPAVPEVIRTGRHLIYPGDISSRSIKATTAAHGNAMLHIFKERVHQQYRTLNYPEVQPGLSDRYLGLPALHPSPCGNCHACLDVCPSGALSLSPKGPVLDMGRCLFCGACSRICTEGKITFTHDHHVASFSREGLIVTGSERSATQPQRDLSLFSRSLKLREVSAGGCNACEADTNVLGTLVYDLGRFGIDFVASPRHADGLVVTGPVTENMRQALLDTYEATPEPRLVIAVGTCAISGGIFRDSRECSKGLAELLPVDLFIPGCPPNPWSILDGLLAIKGIQSSQKS